MTWTTYATAVLLSFPFASLPLGSLSDKDLQQNSKQIVWSHLQDRMELCEEAEGHRYLRVTYPASKWGSKDSGAQALFSLPDSVIASCEYKVRFHPGFDFVKGGKLPGLAGGTSTAGGSRPTGDGWTARYMWRRNGEAVLYLYHLDQANNYADDLPLKRRFQPGKWHHLKQEISVNTDDKANGRIRVWLDGELVLDRTKVRLQTQNQAPVNRFYFSTFFGGEGIDWAPSKTQFIDFAEIEVKTVSEETSARN